MPAEVETFVYRKEEGEPWHGLGKSWTGYLTPKNVQELCDLNWGVIKIPSFYELDGDVHYTGWDALIRDSDKYKLDMVSEDWNDVSNDTAFEFFDEYCQAGNIQMSTAGSLQHGRIVFALAKLGVSFDLFRGKDLINAYLLFTNPHKYGWSTSVSLNAIRVVCMNTLKLSLASTAKDKIVRVTHRNEFDLDQVKETLGIAKKKIEDYKETAKFLAKSKAKKFDVVEYFKELFPVLTKKSDPKKDISKAAESCCTHLETQPGAEFANGTWWNGYNAVSFHLDHLASRERDTRVTSAWYGTGATKKVEALKKAVEYAKATA